MFEALKDLGMRPMQESVFWGYLRVAEKRAVQRLLTRYCCEESDRALMFRVTLADLKEVFLVNYQSDAFDPVEFEVYLGGNSRTRLDGAA